MVGSTDLPPTVQKAVNFSPGGGGGGGVSWVSLCWVCAAGISWPIIDPILVTFGQM